MKRLVLALAAAGGLGALLSGCVVAPVDPYYGYGYGYRSAPVVVQPSVNIGYSRGYYGGRGYGRGPYGGWWR